MLFDGYTGGGGKEIVDGLMSTGDVGHLDAAGRLFVDGRDDDMIVSGGENVFPQEVEELLVGHEAIQEVAVMGVDDDDFGQRLAPTSCAATAPRSTPKPSRHTCGRTWRASRSARRRVPGRPPTQSHRQGAQARAERRGRS